MPNDNQINQSNQALVESILNLKLEFKEEFNKINSKIDAKIEPLHTEITKISTMLRNYNGLWEKVDEVEKEINQTNNKIVGVNGKIKSLETDLNTKERTSINYVNWIFTGIVAAVAVIGLFV